MDFLGFENLKFEKKKSFTISKLEKKIFFVFFLPWNFIISEAEMPFVENLTSKNSKQKSPFSKPRP